VTTRARQPYTPDAILRIGRRRKWQIVVPAIVVGVAASWWIHRLPDRYRADTLLLVVPQRVPEAFVRSTVATRGDDRLQSITLQILSRTLLEQIIRDFDLYAEERKTAAMQDIVDSMRTRDIEIQSMRGDAFRLSFVASSPQVAMQVATRLASLFIGQTSLDRETIANGTDRFLETQLDEARRKLVDTEGKLEEYRRRHNGELPAQLDTNVQGQHNTEMQLQALTDALNRDRDRQLVLERSLKDANLTAALEASSPTRGRAVPADPSKLSAAEQLARAEAALKDMQSTLTAQHPDIVSAKQTVAQLQRRAEAEKASQGELSEAGSAERLRPNRLEDLRTELSEVERQIAQKIADSERLRAVLLNYERRIEHEPAREAELAVLTRDYDTLQQTYRALLAKKQESEIAANLERQRVGAPFKVLDPPRLPERPFAPHRVRLYLIGTLAGLGVGLVFAVCLEWFSRGLRTEDEVRVALGLPVLTAIPRVRVRRPGIRRAATLVSAGAALVAGAVALVWEFLK